MLKRTSLAALLALSASSAMATTYNFNAGDNVYGTPIASGDVWNLNGPGIYYANVSQTVFRPILPANGTFTIDGNGNSLTLNDGAGHSVQMRATNLVLNFSDVTITGGNATLAGGAIVLTTSGLANTSTTINATGGTVAFTNNRTARDGGAIAIGNNVIFNAVSGDIVFSGNSDHRGANSLYFNQRDTDSSAIFNVGVGHSITFYDPFRGSETQTAPFTLLKTGDGILSFDGSLYSTYWDTRSAIKGDTKVQGGTFEIANGATYGVVSAVSSPNSFTSDAGTMLQGGGIGTLAANTVVINGDLSIAGRRSYSQGYSTFTISSPDITFGGGKIFFNTYLDDGSSQQSDKLVLSSGTGGNLVVSGNAVIFINNTGGPGGVTNGNKGILIIQGSTGSTGAGERLISDTTFRLGAPVIAGAYEYTLSQNHSDGNWYLTNYLPTPLNPDSPVDPDSPAAPLAGSVPNIQPSVPTHAAVTPIATEYGYALLDTLHERVGDTFVQPLAPAYEERTVRCKSGRGYCTVRVAAPATAAEQTKWASSGWARLIGTRGFHDAGNFLRRGPDYNYTFGAIQAGLDIFGHESRNGALDKVGLYAAYGQIDSTVKGQNGGKAGSVDMDAYTVGGYWTHKAPQGWYTDAVVQATWYSATTTTLLGQKTSPDGFGILGSLEGGYAFKLGNGFSFEPQAQVVYQNISFDDVSDSYMVGYRFSGGESLRARIGARLAKTWGPTDGPQPRQITAWLRANVWHEFMGKSQVAVGDIRDWNSGTFVMPTYLGGTWGEIGTGVTAQVSDNVNLFATGAYSRSLDNKGREAWDGRLGATVKW